MKTQRFPNLKWIDWKTDKPAKDVLESDGMYLVWSKRYGVRLTTENPSWWNLSSRRAGGTPGLTVRFYYRIGPVGLGSLLDARIRRARKAK
jgi:hypothetical protein